MKKILFILLLSISTIGIYGCSQEEYFSNDEEKKQFTEIISASGEMIGIIDNNKEIERFVKQLDIESWNDMEQWKYADNAPKPRDVGCQIVKFMLSRDSNKIILLI